MRKLVNKIRKLQNSNVKNIVDSKIKNFESYATKPTKEWFGEMCFCLLTANSKAKTALAIQDQLGVKGFCSASHDEVCQCIIDNKHRFHNNKTKYIIEARKYIDIKNLLSGLSDKDAREWLVKNVKGLGYKEASHFLRNVGYKSLAILDRHILNLMVDTGLLTEKPKSLNKSNYLEIEYKLYKLCQKTGLNQAELDFYLWYMKTGKILK